MPRYCWKGKIAIEMVGVHGSKGNGGRSVCISIRAERKEKSCSRYVQIYSNNSVVEILFFVPRRGGRSSVLV